MPFMFLISVFQMMDLSRNPPGEVEDLGVLAADSDFAPNDTGALAIDLVDEGGEMGTLSEKFNFKD